MGVASLLIAPVSQTGTEFLVRQKTRLKTGRLGDFGRGVSKTLCHAITSGFAHPVTLFFLSKDKIPPQIGAAAYYFRHSYCGTISLVY